jgi:NitT/TauT family transport system permease protein
MRRWLVRLGFLAGLVLVWHALASARLWSPVLLPSPTSVLAWTVEAARDGTLATATFVTLRRLVVGFAVGVAIGLPVGLLSARWRTFDDTVGLLARGAQSLPSVCWAPIAILWFTRADMAMGFVVVMGTVGSIAIAAADGVRAVPPSTSASRARWARAAPPRGSASCSRRRSRSSCRA